MARQFLTYTYRLTLLASVCTVFLTGLSVETVYGGTLGKQDYFSFDNPVVDAADQGKQEELLQLIRSGNPVDSRGSFGVTPLMRAAYRGDLAMVQTLLKLGANPNTTDVGGASALHLAARQGHNQVTKFLLDAGAKPDISDDEGWTPLMRATASHREEVAASLLAKGANARKKNDTGENALQIAAQAGDKETMKVFLGKETLSDSEQKSLMAIAVQKGDAEMQKLLTPPSQPAMPLSGSVEVSKSITSSSSSSSSSSAPTSTKVAAAPVTSTASTGPSFNLFSWLKKPFQSTASTPSATTKPATTKPTATSPLPSPKTTQAAPVAPKVATRPVVSKAQQQQVKEIYDLPWLKTQVTAKPVIPVTAAPVQPSKTPQTATPVVIAAPTKIPVAAVSKPSASIATASNVKVAEAVRVPLASTATSAKRTAPPMRFAPSDSRALKDTEWLEVKGFASSEEAERRIVSVQSSTHFDGIRIRVITGLDASDKTASIRVGPLPDKAKGDALCKLLGEGKKPCQYVQDLGKSTSIPASHEGISTAVAEENRKEEQYRGAAMYWLQLGSFSSEKNAEDRRASLKDLHKDLLGELSFYISTPKRGSHSQSLFRLRVGPFALQSKADSLCDTLESKGVDCIVIRD